MKSSSIHNLNADEGLGFFKKITYLFLNGVNNLFPYSNVDRRINIRHYHAANLDKHLAATFESSSVGRRLSDIFWRDLPWQKIKEELGEIHVFDTGCGHGNYGVRLQNASGNMISSYVGVDSKKRPNWEILEQQNKNFKFIESASTNISDLIPPETNFFITQSAIEHFDEDLGFFDQIHDFISKSDGPIIQVHNFPARAILPLYLFHGIRQYTPRTVSKITRLFDEKTKIHLFGLGGKQGKKVHWKYITWPLFILRKGEKRTLESEMYNKDVVEAVKKDFEKPGKHPIFWVLIIHSRPKKIIW